MKKYFLIILVLSAVLAVPSASASCGDLKVFYSFDGSTIADESGCSNDPASTTATSFEQGVINEALVFDGSSTDVDIGQIYDETNDFTYASWVNTDSDHNGILISTWDGSFNGFQIKKKGGGQFRFKTNDGSDSDLDTQAFPNNEWHHVAFTYDASTDNKSIWVNASLEATETAGTTDASASTHLGVTDTGANYLDGSQDQVRLYANKTLTQSEIQSLYENGTSSGGSSNSAPVFSSFTPSDNSEGVSTSTSLSTDVSDSDNSTMEYVDFYWGNGTLIESKSSVSTGTVSTSQLSLDTDTQYNWYVEASDGIDITTSATKSFTTEIGGGTYLFDSFEDQDMAEYTNYAGGGGFLFDTSYVRDGDYSAHVDGEVSDWNRVYRDGFTVSDNVNISAYIRADADSEDNERGLLYAYDGATSTKAYRCGIWGQLNSYDFEDGYGKSSSTELNLGTWYNIELSIRDDTVSCKAYDLDGNLVDSHSYTRNDSVTDFGVGFGLSGYTGQNRRGWIDSFTVEDSNASSDTEGNDAPILDNFDPSDGEGSVAIDTDISFNYSDPDGDNGNVTLKWSDGTLIEDFENVSSGTNLQSQIKTLDYDTSYTYEVNATDGNTSSVETVSFTTQLDPDEILRLHYNFDNKPPVDKSGNNNDGSIVGSVTQESNGITKSEGDWGDGGNYDFPGSTGNYVDTEYLPPTGSSPRSMFAWVRTSSGTENAVFDYGTEANGERLTFRVRSDGDLRFETANGGIQYEGQNLADGNWHHVGFTYNGSGTYNGLKLWVDGVNVLEGSGSTIIDTGSTNTLAIGQERTLENRNPFEGDIDEPKVYSAELSSADVQDLYESNSIGTSSVSQNNLVNLTSPVDGLRTDSSSVDVEYETINFTADATGGTLKVQEAGEEPLEIAMYADPHYTDTERAKFPSEEKIRGNMSLFMESTDPDVYVNLGDLADSLPTDSWSTDEQGSTSNEVYMNRYGNASKWLAGNTSKPFYAITGNHEEDEISCNNVQLSELQNEWESHGGEFPSGYYSVDVEGYQLIFLRQPTETCPGSDHADHYYPQDELDWLKNELSSTDRPAIVFEHVPDWDTGEDYSNLQNQQSAQDIMAGDGDVISVYHGHHHWNQADNFQVFEDGLDYYHLSLPYDPYQNWYTTEHNRISENYTVETSMESDEAGESWMEATPEFSPFDFWNNTVDLGEVVENSTNSVSLGLDDSTWYKYGVEVTTSSSGNITSDSYRYLTTDTGNPPSISVESPVDGQTYSDSSIDLNVTSSESIDTWKYSLDGGANSTFSPNTTISGLSDGSHSVDVWANDSNGNWGNNDVSFTVDTTPPSISYNSGTTDEGLKTGQDWIFINISASDNLGLQSVTQQFNGTNSSFANSNNGYYWENHTNLQNGNYSFKAFAADKVNSESTSTREVEIDTPVSSFNQFSIETSSEWDQGSYVNLSYNGGLDLKLGGTDGKIELVYSHDYVEIYDYQTKSSIQLDGSVDSVSERTIGEPVDFNGDGYPDIPYLESSNLMYYDLKSYSKTDTGVDANQLSGAADIGGDGDQDLMVELSSSGEMAYYDTGSDSLTDLPTSLDIGSLGYPGDIDSDGSPEVPYLETASPDVLGYYDFNSSSTNTIVSDDNIQFVGDIGDKTSLGGKEVAVAYNNQNFKFYNTSGSSQNADASTETYGAGAYADYDDDGNQELPFHTPYNNDEVIALYDLSLKSVSYLENASHDLRALDAGGGADIDYRNSGEYESKVFSYEKKQEWNNITLGSLSRPGDSNVTVKFQTSNDGFSTVNETIYVNDSDLTDGTYNYSLSGLQQATTDARVTLMYERGAGTPSVDALTVYSETENNPPSIPQQDFEWLNLGGDPVHQLIYTLSDPDGNDITGRNSPPSGSVLKFTNSTYKVSSFTDVFDYRAEIEDTRGHTAHINSNFSLDKTVPFYTPDPGYVHNASRQKVNGSIQFDIRGDDSIYEVTAVNPENTKTVVSNGNKSTGTGTTGTVSASWGWIVDQVNTTTFSTEMNQGENSNLSTQYVVRYKQASNIGGSNFDQLEVQPVQPSVGSCSNCDPRNISLSAGETQNVSFNASGDFVNEKEYGVGLETSRINLRNSYKANVPLEVNNTGSFPLSGLNTSAEISVSECSQSNNTLVDVSGNSAENFSVGLSCNPGTIGDPTQGIQNISTSKERVWYNSTDMVIADNRTEETEFVIPADKSAVKNPDERDGGSLEAFVEGVNSSSSNELNVSDNGEYFNISVGNGFQNSSLHTDDTEWKITYTLSDDSTTVSGSGSSGAVDIIPDKDEVILFEDTGHDVPYGTETIREFKIENVDPQTHTVQVTRNGSSGFCQFVTVQKDTTSDSYGQVGRYTVPGTTGTNIRYVDVKYDLSGIENKTELEDKGITSTSCGFGTDVLDSDNLTADSLTFEANPEFNLFETLLEGLRGFIREFYNLQLSQKYCRPDLDASTSEQINQSQKASNGECVTGETFKGPSGAGAAAGLILLAGVFLGQRIIRRKVGV